MSHSLQPLIEQLQLDRSQIQQRRNEVRHQILSASRSIQQDNFHSIHQQDLVELFAIYDQVFFDNRFGKQFETNEHGLTFRLSSRMTSTGGTTSFRKQRRFSDKQYHYEIAISTTLLFNTRFEARERVKVGGVPVENRLDALQRIFEHELSTSWK